MYLLETSSREKRKKIKPINRTSQPSSINKGNELTATGIPVCMAGVYTSIYTPSDVSRFFSPSEGFYIFLHIWTCVRILLHLLAFAICWFFQSEIQFWLQLMLLTVI